MARPPRAAGDLVDDSRCAPFAAPGEAAAKLVVDDTAAAALDAGIQPDDEAIKGGCASRAALLGGRATSALPRLGPRADRCTSGESADDARSGWGDPEAGAQSVGRPGVPGVSGESAPPRPERLRRILQTAAVAQPHCAGRATWLVRGAPPMIATATRAPQSLGLVPLGIGPWRLGVEALGAPRAPISSPRGDVPVLTGRRTLERGATPRSRNAAGAIPRGESGPCDPRRADHPRRIGALDMCRPGHPYSPRQRAQREHERRPRSRLAEAGPGPGRAGTAHSGRPGRPGDPGRLQPKGRRCSAVDRCACELAIGRWKLGVGRWASLTRATS